MLDSPGTNLIVFAVLTAGAALLFWPRRGLLTRYVRQRAMTSRVLLEDALKHVYHHERSGHTATVASLGGALETPQATAVELVDRMQQAGLVTLADGRILLNERGERYALQVIRAHRLWERYLADETGVDPREWHAAADRHEHELTPESADALAERLGHPRFDPHGDPIPTSEGEVPALDEQVTPLPEISEGVSVSVVHVEDEPEAVYAELLAQGIHPGDTLTVLRRDERRVVLDGEGRIVTISPVVAANVSVRPTREPAKGATASAFTLADLAIGEHADVVRISHACRGLERRRLMDLGIVPGTSIALERRGMAGGPSAYRVRGTLIALRAEQAVLIGVDAPAGKAAS